MVQINGGVFGSTGRIMFSLADALEARGDTVLCAAPVTVTNRFREPDHPYRKIGTFRSRQFCVLLDRITGIHGGSAIFATAALLRRIRSFKPDAVHLHNIHGSFINLPMLFRYLKKSGVRVIWTLHDCWAFTGHCAHYDGIGCDKWRRECGGCPQYRAYPKSYYDSSKLLFRLKKRWFTGLESMQLVTPSKWLADQIPLSFLKEYPAAVIHNGIDTDTFRPVKSDFRARHGIRDDQVMLLGVAFGWNEKKGLSVFRELAGRLDGRYRIVLTGTDEAVEARLPESIISVRRTQDREELAVIYTAADVLINPTLEDTFPTVNLEALACGTPVITFRTGGSPETLDDSCGRVVEKNDTDALIAAIHELTGSHRIDPDACTRWARGFSNDKFTDNYLNLL